MAPTIMPHTDAVQLLPDATKCRPKALSGSQGPLNAMHEWRPQVCSNGCPTPAIGEQRSGHCSGTAGLDGLASTRTAAASDVESTSAGMPVEPPQDDHRNFLKAPLLPTAHQVCSFKQPRPLPQAVGGLAEECVTDPLRLFCRCTARPSEGPQHTSCGHLAATDTHADMLWLRTTRMCAAETTRQHVTGSLDTI